jgi:hypothetical protein
MTVAYSPQDNHGRPTVLPPENACVGLQEGGSLSRSPGSSRLVHRDNLEHGGLEHRELGGELTTSMTFCQTNGACPGQDQ